MDTKWKNRKKAISFMIFFLGVSLVLGGFMGVLKNRPAGVKAWQVEKMLEDDYQLSRRFREYIAGRLEKFLIMATGGSLGYLTGDGIYHFDDGNSYYDGNYEDIFYYGSGYGADNYWYWNYGYDQGYYDIIQSYDDIIMNYLQSLDDLWSVYSDRLEGIGQNAESYAQEMEIYREDLEAMRRELEAARSELQAGRESLEAYGSREEASSGEEKPSIEEQNKKLAQKYHELIKNDQNLIYSISYDGKLLYANGELTVKEDSADAPQGYHVNADSYNFFLFFDGEKVNIIKDGKNVDVYGDGFYWDFSDGNEESWYVPGYRNFRADEELKKVEIFIAVAKDPVLYVKGDYGNGGSREYDNMLYWMNYNCRENRRVILEATICLCVGLVLTLVSFFCRKSSRETKEEIARLQAKIWVECKVLYFGILCAGFLILVRNYSYGGWNEWGYLISDGYLMDGISMFFSVYIREALREVPILCWLLLFWSLWLAWNDFRYNKKVWKNGLAAKLYHTFSARQLDQSLSKKMAVRNGIIFCSTVVFGFFVAVLAGLGLSRHLDNRGVGILVLLGMGLYVVIVYRVGAKNMETAKDLEALAGCVGEIRNGNYKNFSGQFTGHDLENVMEQMEDIRCGMAKAVDEQMKSERMKVELIANVSHDIKTPLTSIISYVQFLKQEEGLPDHVKDYVTILDEKSQRLKNMVQDVFAVSKAASGELPMQMEKLDFGKLLRQTLADMEEEIGKSPVAFRTEIPGEPVMIMADGQRMYRVFQNLFQNAIQYSLEGSRVYVSLKTDGGLAVASVKNTSHQELEKGKDFTERFIRGDQSRTDGGSGLGLSIAQSFTEACGGEFAWETDADLFIVRVSFRTM